MKKLCVCVHTVLTECFGMWSSGVFGVENAVLAHTPGVRFSSRVNDFDLCDESLLFSETQEIQIRICVPVSKITHTLMTNLSWGQQKQVMNYVEHGESDVISPTLTASFDRLFQNVYLASKIQ